MHSLATVLQRNQGSELLYKRKGKCENIEL